MKKHLKENPMKPMNILIKTLIGWPFLRSSFTLIALALFCAAAAPKAFGVVPAPDGGYPGGNTAEGQSALLSLTSGTYNTAVGFFSLLSNAEGKFNTGVGAGTLLANTADENTATGAGALLSNTTGGQNTANGAFALFSNTEGGGNTAIGDQALFSNTTGGANTASGAFALFFNTEGAGNTAIGGSALINNTSGNGNTASGASALFSNTSGDQNTATGFGALVSNSTGDYNTATGYQALAANTAGFRNTAIGRSALISTTGSNNVALGDGAGFNATTGSDNVYIGADVVGVAGETSACYIKSIFGKTSVNGIPVLINSDRKLGTTTSSKRFKEDIKPMDKASEAILALKPVTFHYKKELDPAGRSQFGLVAEEVEEVNPDLVVRDKEGQVYSVRYDQVNAMLLNEFLKEHKKVEEQQATITELKCDFQMVSAQQQNEIQILGAQLKEQATQIQRVSAQVEIRKPTTKVVLNKP